MKHHMIRKGQPTAGDVHVDRPLTMISIAFLQDPQGFVADAVFPNIPVAAMSDKYFTFPRGMFLRNQMAKRAEGTETQGIGYSVSTDSYIADVWGLHHDIPDQRRANADSPLQPDREATELLTTQAMISREAEWASKFFGTGIWTTGRTGVAAAPVLGTSFLVWSNPNSTPIEDVEEVKQTILALTGFEPNVLVIDRRSWGTIRNHPEIVDRIKFSSGPGSPAVVNLNAVAQVLDVERVLVGRGVKNTSIEGGTDAFNFLIPEGALLAYAAPNPGIMVPSAGYTFSWTGLLGAGPQGQRISRFRMEHLKSDRVEIEMAYAQKVVSADLGAFLTNTI